METDYKIFIDYLSGIVNGVKTHPPILPNSEILEFSEFEYVKNYKLILNSIHLNLSEKNRLIKRYANITPGYYNIYNKK